MERITVTGIGSGMQGVGRLEEGCVAFVSGALPGEEVEIEITRRAQRFCEARLLRVCAPSPERRTPDCPAYGVCGGCQARHMAYAETLRLKRQRVFDALSRLGGVQNPEVRDTIGCADPDRTRNKAEFPIGRGADGRVVIGAYAEGSRRIVPLQDCLLQRESAAHALRYFSEHLSQMPGAGHYTHLVTRVNRRGELMLTLCAGAPIMDSAKKLLPELQKALPEMISFYFLCQNQRPAHALDGAISHLWGERMLNETLLGLQFAISPQSFFQINPEQTEKLYSCALEAAGLKQNPNARVLDVYCGAGTISLAAARLCKSVTGVEIVAPAIRDAKENARRNGLETRTRFICADAAKEIPRLISAGERFDCAIVDPPRKGVDEPALRALLAARPDRIAYVSCNPATLARDVRLLSEAYRMEWAQPVDMFPWTEHVETVVLLSRETNPLTVEVRMEVETGEVKEHPTYKRIQEYVQEKYGFKVHTAYIAEVKRMVGLDMHKAPNAVEQRKHEYHPCPPEKVEAIKDALRHFGLISG